MLPRDLFTTNRAPTPEQLEVARKVLNTAKSRLATVRQLLADLTIEEKNLVSLIHDHEPVVAPFRRLPDDILGEIMQTATGPMARAHPREAPFIFTRVSQHVRQISLSMPALWSAMTFDITKIEDTWLNMKGNTAFITMVSQCLLTLSGKMPLSITIHGNMDRSQIGKAIFDILLTLTSRWKEITLTSISENCTQLLSALQPADVPILRTLDLTFFGPHALWGSGLLQSHNLSRLRLVYYMGKHFHIVRSSPPPTVNWTRAWRKLTHLTITGVFGKLLPLLEQTTSLVFLELLLVTEGHFLVDQEIHFPSLKTLSITFQRFQPQDVLDIIQAPNVQELRLRYGGEQWNKHLLETSLITFCSRMPHIERLATDVDLPVLQSALRSVPSLKMLLCYDVQGRYDVRGSQNSADESITFLDIFTSDNANQLVCPLLEYFRCLRALQPDANAIRRFYTRKNGTVSALSPWRHAEFTLDYRVSHWEIRELVEILMKDMKRDTWVDEHFYQLKPAV